MKSKRIKIIAFSPLLFMGFVTSYGQSVKKISGVVLGSKGEKLTQVSILSNDSIVKTNANADGTFDFSIDNRVKYLRFTAPNKQDFTVRVDTVQNDLRIGLSDLATTSLDEVVVVGYGSSRRQDLTGAVASVKSSDILKTATADPMQAIQGRVSGVQIVSNSGEPGSGVTVKIRGVGSIGGSNPIYVVDGFQTSDISYLGPNDIESMDVLKDASATAIYGARGANGVVVVTTKKGRSGGIKADFNLYTGVQSAWRKIPMTNSQQYATLVEEAYTNDGSSVPSSYANLLDSAKNGLIGTTNWQDVVLRNGLVQSYSAGLSGGSAVNRFRMSTTYFDQNGIILNTGMKKYFINFNDQFTANKWLKGGMNAAFSHFHKTNYTGDYYTGVLSNALQGEPIISVYDATGNWSRNTISYTNNAKRIVDFIKNNNTYGSLLVGNVWLEASITKDLTFKSQFNAMYDNQHIVTYTPTFYIDNVEMNSTSSLYDYRAEGNNWVWTNYANYKKNIGGHSFNLMAGAEWQNNTWEETSTTAYNVPSASSLQTLANTLSTNYTVTATKYSTGLQSFFARLNYNFEDKYLFTATVRDDASSKFLKGYRSGIFPAFSGAWVISKESFFDSKLISFMKLRAGWGRVGNEQSADAYPYITQVTSNNLYVIGGSSVQGYAPSTFGNSKLTWEKNEQTNIGVDINLFDDRLTFSGDVFNRVTKNLILSVPVPAYSGAAASPYMNTGVMANKGIELSLGYKGGRKLLYSVGGNVTFLSNKLKSLGLGDVMSLASTGKLGYVSRAEAGMPFPFFYGLKTDGIFHNQSEVDSYVNSSGSLIQPNAQPGDVKFVDKNGDGSITTSDYTNLGNPNPKIQFGFNATLNYHNFDLAVFLQGVTGNKILNAMYYNVMSVNNASGGWSNFMSDRWSRWTTTNTNTNQPRMTEADANGNMKFSDRYIESGAYLRFKSLQLGYTIPKNVLKRYGIDNVRFYVASDNLLTITGYKGFDPEVSGYYSSDPAYTGVDVGSYPQARSFRIGLSLGL